MEAIERLLAERACERLINAYSHFIDHGEASKVATLFTEDGVWRSAENTMQGRAGVEKGFMARQNNTRRISKHVCSTALIDIIDDEHATGVVYFTLYRYDGEPGQTLAPPQAPSVVGEYRDRYLKVDGDWLIQRRDVGASFAEAAPK